MKEIKALLSTSSIYRLVTMGDTGEPMELEIGGHEAEVQLCTHRVQSDVRPGSVVCYPAEDVLSWL